MLGHFPFPSSHWVLSDFQRATQTLPQPGIRASGRQGFLTSVRISGERNELVSKLLFVTKQRLSPAVCSRAARTASGSREHSTCPVNVTPCSGGRHCICQTAGLGAHEHPHSKEMRSDTSCLHIDSISPDGQAHGQLPQRPGTYNSVPCRVRPYTAVLENSLVAPRLVDHRVTI